MRRQRCGILPLNHQKNLKFVFVFLRLRRLSWWTQRERVTCILEDTLIQMKKLRKLIHIIDAKLVMLRLIGDLSIKWSTLEKIIDTPCKFMIETFSRVMILSEKFNWISSTRLRMHHCQANQLVYPKIITKNTCRTKRYYQNWSSMTIVHSG